MVRLWMAGGHVLPSTKWKLSGGAAFGWWGGDVGGAGGSGAGGGGGGGGGGSVIGPDVDPHMTKPALVTKWSARHEKVSPARMSTLIGGLLDRRYSVVPMVT